MATILEALQNANYNLQAGILPLQIRMGKAQLNNAVSLLEKGYPLETDVEQVLDTFGSLEEVTDFKELY